MSDDQIAAVPSNYPGFLLQIVRPNGTVIRIPTGERLETDLINLCIAHVTALGVGVGRTTKHVAGDIRKGMANALMAYKIEAARAQHTVDFPGR